MHWKHVWHMDKCVDKWNMNLWMNECDTNFSSSYKFVCQICFQCMISMCETYELWMNEFCTIFITKSWNVTFVMDFLHLNQPHQPIEYGSISWWIFKRQPICSNLIKRIPHSGHNETIHQTMLMDLNGLLLIDLTYMGFKPINFAWNLP
jgi:hypothetical protein